MFTISANFSKHLFFQHFFKVFSLLIFLRNIIRIFQSFLKICSYSDILPDILRIFLVCIVFLMEFFCNFFANPFPVFTSSCKTKKLFCLLLPTFGIRNTRPWATEELPSLIYTISKPLRPEITSEIYLHYITAHFYENIFQNFHFYDNEHAGGT